MDQKKLMIGVGVIGAVAFFCCGGMCLLSRTPLAPPAPPPAPEVPAAEAQVGADDEPRETEPNPAPLPEVHQELEAAEPAPEPEAPPSPVEVAEAASPAREDAATVEIRRILGLLDDLVAERRSTEAQRRGLSRDDEIICQRASVVPIARGHVLFELTLTVNDQMLSALAVQARSCATCMGGTMTACADYSELRQELAGEGWPARRTTADDARSSELSAAGRRVRSSLVALVQQARVIHDRSTCRESMSTVRRGVEAFREEMQEPSDVLVEALYHRAQACTHCEPSGPVDCDIFLEMNRIWDEVQPPR